MKWKPIADLPEDLRALRRTELTALREVWRRHKESLEGSAELAEFLARWNREWAIETGVIEGVYTLDRETTRALVEHGITASLISHSSTDRSPELVARMIQD
ncbi:MAG: Fic family protein, partial [Bryobacteraceae bacterium]